jgi:hypothetical protein
MLYKFLISFMSAKIPAYLNLIILIIFSERKIVKFPHYTIFFSYFSTLF